MTPEQEVQVENMRRIRVGSANDRISDALFGPMLNALWTEPVDEVFTGGLRIAIRQKQTPEPLEGL